MIKDGDWTLYDYAFASGRSVWHYFDGEKHVFRTDYPVDTIMAENTSVRNAAQKAWKGDWHRVASIPLNLAYDQNLVRAQAEGDDTFVKRWLNDSDNAAWRTKEGRL